MLNTYESSWASPPRHGKLRYFAFACPYLPPKALFAPGWMSIFPDIFIHRILYHTQSTGAKLDGFKLAGFNHVVNVTFSATEGGCGGVDIDELFGRHG
jgi:hypothetical protein